jgi:hypothetical protein
LQYARHPVFFQTIFKIPHPQIIRSMSEHPRVRQLSQYSAILIPIFARLTDLSVTRNARESNIL